MRIVIDLQGAQGESRLRGIGRYSLSLAKAIVEEASGHEVLLALNGQLAESIEPIRTAFDAVLPQENIRVWSPLMDGEPVANVNERLREAFLASLRPDVVHVSSLFEGFASAATTSVGVFSTALPTAITLYDLIPYIHPQPYLDDPRVRSWYLAKLGHLRRADMLMGISESARREAVHHLGIPEASTVNISTAADDHFRRIDVSPTVECELRQKYGLKKPFLMYTGGIDHRKNIEGLIRSFARLPEELRGSHQLVIVCSVSTEAKRPLERLAQHHGLAGDDVVFTGFVPDTDLVLLYNVCTLFVFPSLHEGFGLPVLEAMQCGAPVIGADASSVPEVIGRTDALFDPRRDEAMAAKMAEVLSDAAFRDRLVSHAAEQSKRFSWRNCAQRAIDALEDIASQRSRSVAASPSASRPKLAYVSPLPPARSGIADYSAELLPELARFYDIDAVVAQTEPPDPAIAANCTIRSVDWFVEHADHYDRVMYHFGNSVFHEHMFELLNRVPGVVVLHDFYLSDLQAHREAHLLIEYAWVRELYRSHGYNAVRERFNAVEAGDVVRAYPCNFGVLERANGIIVHSEHSRRLAGAWYGAVVAKDWKVVPLLRVMHPSEARLAARRSLGMSDDEFVICSFGMLGTTKQNHRLLDAWLASNLALDPRCRLVFVGENERGEYGRELSRAIEQSEVSGRVRITGWSDTQTFRLYLAATDMAVQLRTASRGETSAAVLDCIGAGVPTIVNANGAMAELPGDAVTMLPDDFCNEELTAAIEELYTDAPRRRKLSERGVEVVATNHDPRRCAEQYSIAIERFYIDARNTASGLVGELSRGAAVAFGGSLNAVKLAEVVARSMPTIQPARQLMVDVSVLLQVDANSGIQRVVRSILKNLLDDPPSGYRVEPVYATVASSGYRYARKFTLGMMGCPDSALQDQPVDVQANDIFLGLDLHPPTVIAQASYFDRLRQLGARVMFVVYDLLPIAYPDSFPSGTKAGHEDWLRTVARADGAICISKAVADELAHWVAEYSVSVGRPLRIDWFHLGADLEDSIPTTGVPMDAALVLESLDARPSFLMVGTLEPRKSHAQALAAFERLWGAGVDVNLVVVGKQGWMVDELARALQKHPERSSRLHWLADASDEFLAMIYGKSTALIAGSQAEGFGLPLIEAARHGLPIIARDIAVFREVAGDGAFYFCGDRGADLERALLDWLALRDQQLQPLPTAMTFLTWKQSVEQLKQVMLQWAPA